MKLILKKFLPLSIYNFLVNVKLYFELLFVLLSNFFIVKKKHIENKRIKVCFLVIHRAVWKLDNLYRLLENDSRFEPIIVICPYTTVPENIQNEEMNSALYFFEQLGYNVVSSKHYGGWLDINEAIKPDVVFFTNPHNLTLPQYLWSNFREFFTCYVPYHHQVDAGQWNSQWNSKFHLSMSKLFYVNSYHKELAKDKMLNNGRNVEITGYPGTEDLYLNMHNKKHDLIVWKNIQNRKKIIWAPHHTIEYDQILGVSEFLNISEAMVELSKKYKSEIVFAFKPHPVLKSKLYNHQSWGKEKTDEYYKYWNEAENCQLEEGEYINLFKQSDAMIHDSGSFLAEYLYLNKPVFYFINDSTSKRFNAFGLNCLDVCTKGNFADLEEFIIAIINDNDVNCDKRKAFVFSELIDIEESSYPSKKIFNILSSEFFRG